jgi:hypothetical protein
MRHLLVLGHAAIVAVLLAALLRWEASVAAKILVGGLGAGLFFLLSTLQQQLERLVEIHATLRLILVSRETQRVDRRNRTPAVKILANDLEQEAADEEIKKQLSGRTIGRKTLVAAYLFVVVMLTFIATMVWP